MATANKFRKAQRVKCKASILIDGLSGNGKSGLALSIAHALADKNWNDIYAIDTENRSLDLYMGLPMHTGDVVEEFNVVDLLSEDGFNPRNYAALRDQAIALKAKVVIMDSISHAWQYKGGILDMVSTIQTKGGPSSNKWTAWGTPEVVDEKAALMDLIRSPHCHIITTVRVKEKMEMIPNEITGKQEVKSLGEQQIQMPELKYEPDLVLSMIAPGDGDRHKAPKAKVTKSRYAILKKDEEYEFTAELLEQLRTYLAEGADPAELIEAQRQDYITAIKDYINEDKATRQAYWELLKENHDLKEVKLVDIPLHDLKIMFGKLVA